MPSLAPGMGSDADAGAGAGSELGRSFDVESLFIAWRWWTHWQGRAGASLDPLRFEEASHCLMEGREVGCWWSSGECFQGAVRLQRWRGVEWSERC